MTTETTGAAKMNEQQLRAAVAEYDAKLNWYVRENLLVHQRNGNGWGVAPDEITLLRGDYTALCKVIGSHAATMRAMDAAAQAFQESLGREGK